VALCDFAREREKGSLSKRSLTRRSPEGQRLGEGVRRVFVEYDLDGAFAERIGTIVMAELSGDDTGEPVWPVSLESGYGILTA